MVVSNTSPLLYLAKLGKLDLLKKLFDKIIIPETVYEEVVLKGKERGFIDAVVIDKAINDGWIEVRQVTFDKKIESYSSEVDAGELAVIQLAKKLNSALTLIDDAPARIIAEGLGLKVKGTLHVLLKAYSKKLIKREEIKKLLSRLISLGFRISPELYGKVLEEIDES
jgi:predicted nucleic acid-binding protein